jgi:hypothetical protein
MDEEPDTNDILLSLLTTEEGKNLTEAVVDLKAHIEVIAQQLTMHNKIMVKILTALSQKSEPQ